MNAPTSWLWVNRVAAGSCRSLASTLRSATESGRKVRASRRLVAKCQKSAIAASPPVYSITSSAIESSVGGTVRPSILAVSALMTSSNLLACATGKSAGLAPLRMRPT